MGACTQSCQRAAAPRRPLLTASHHAAAGRAASPLQVRTFALSACRLRDTDEFGSGRRTGFTEEEEEEEDEEFIDDSEVEELFEQQAGIGEGQHRVFIVHPDVKWGSRKQYLTTGNKRSDEECVEHAGGFVSLTLLLSPRS